MEYGTTLLSGLELSVWKRGNKDDEMNYVANGFITLHNSNIVMSVLCVSSYTVSLVDTASNGKVIPSRLFPMLVLQPVP